MFFEGARANNIHSESRPTTTIIRGEVKAERHRQRLISVTQSAHIIPKMYSSTGRKGDDSVEPETTLPIDEKNQVEQKPTSSAMNTDL